MESPPFATDQRSVTVSPGLTTNGSTVKLMMRGGGKVGVGDGSIGVEVGRSTARRVAVGAIVVVAIGSAVGCSIVAVAGSVAETVGLCKTRSGVGVCTMPISKVRQPANNAIRKISSKRRMMFPHKWSKRYI